jgi:hypothetical protein
VVGLEKIPTLEQIDAMILYTDAQIATEPNPLAVHLLEYHRSVYCRMGDIILNNVKE